MSEPPAPLIDSAGLLRLRDALPLRSGATVLRSMRIDDLPVFHAYRSDPDIARFQAWSPMTVDQAAAFLHAMAGIDRLMPGAWIQLAIADAVADAMLGDIGLHVDGALREAEVGFTLSRHGRGAGHATRAARAAASLLFRLSPVAQVRAIADARNAASIAVLARAGFRRSGEREVVCRGEACREIVHVLTRGDADAASPPGREAVA